MVRKALHIAFFIAVLLSTSLSVAQVPMGGPKTSSPKDSAIIFHSPRPLIEENDAVTALHNSVGFSGLINDYGFGLGFFYRRSLLDNLSAVITFDLGGAKGAKEFGLDDQIKINRVYVMPFFASLQLRLFDEMLSEGFRPYITAGGGPTIVATTDASRDFFSALGHPVFTTTFGGFFGFGAYFGSDPKTTFGASLKYYIIPYGTPGIESTAGHFLTDFSGASLAISYGFNF